MTCGRPSYVEVQLELLVPVATPAIMLLSWDFTARQFALSDGADQRQPEQRRNRGDGIQACAECRGRGLGDHAMGHREAPLADLPTGGALPLGNGPLSGLLASG
jgi:hypothetical protein